MISPCVHVGCHCNQFTKIILVFQANTAVCTTNHQSIKQEPTETRTCAVTVLPNVASTKLNESKNNHSQVHHSLSKATFWTPGTSVITTPTKKVTRSARYSVRSCHHIVTTLCTEQGSNNTTRVQMDSKQTGKTEVTEVTYKTHTHSHMVQSTLQTESLLLLLLLAL